jgi:hypothetical protein
MQFTIYLSILTDYFYENTSRVPSVLPRENSTNAYISY